MLFGLILDTQFTGTPSYHLSLDPSGSAVYTSAFGGRLNRVAIPVGTGNTPTAVNGNDNGVTQIAFGQGARSSMSTDRRTGWAISARSI